MSIWSEVRNQAWLRHVELTRSTESLVPASELIAVAEIATGIKCQRLPAEDPLLDRAAATYNRARQRIYYSAITDTALAAFHIAHEYGHHWLDVSEILCRATEIDPVTPAEPEMSLVGEADAYSPKERAEAQANLFAREFLLPRDKLRRHYLQTSATAQDIATLVGVPVDLVMQQLADAFFLPDETSEAKGPRKEPDPDATQIKAIEAARGPHRVRASPGTGKTRTLVGKVKRLVDEKVDPKSILVLTYSNLAAQDLARRLHAAVGEAALTIWTGTFHAYGLELLRKYSVEAGFEEEPRLRDRTASLMLLEELLPDLSLAHYLDLVDPILPLRSIFALISRAKDELVSPAHYEQLARSMLESNDETEKAAGAKALEVAHAYGVYECALRKRGFVDFGDLIARPVELFKEKPSVRDSARALREHVLVDEYQDMNRASAILLQDLIEPGKGPWVVGDVRQSIYRFRGASPINMARFETDFPGAKTTDLGVNYRSGGRIVRAFESFGSGMASGDLAPLGKIEPHRGETTGRLDYDIGSTAHAEYEGIARAIRGYADENVAAFGDQAVIARSHTTLARLARHLEQSGIPCLYFGDFFERPEIRDMLCLLSLSSENRGIGFYRVAQFPQYNIPPDDVAKIVAWRRDNAISMIEAVRRSADIPDLSAFARASVRKLADDLGGVDFPMAPHRFLLGYLFGGARHLDPILADESVAGQQRRFALYQLLQFAFTFRSAHGSDPKRAFLVHIRRLEMLDEEKQLRQLPAAANGINAVRMMTVHASKGLEFPVVHIPFLTSRHFPTNRTDANPPPPGLVDDSALMSREAEEESLFFVAVSRAENILRLSRAVWHGGGSWSKVKPSPFLGRISQHLPRAVDAAATWTEEGAASVDPPALESKRTQSVWSARAIETYLDCPRRFYYAEVLELGGDDVTSPYVSFHSALHASIAHLRELTSKDEQRQAATARLAQDWSESGLRGQRLETVYRSAAENMIGTALDLLEGTSLPTDLSFSVTDGVTVTCRADHVGEKAGRVIIQRFKASRLATRERGKARYIIMQAAVRERHGSMPVQFEHASLVDGKRLDGTIDPRKLQSEIQTLKDAVANIAAGRFEPTPSEYQCPRCPYYFICPSHGPTVARPA